KVGFTKEQPFLNQSEHLPDLENGKKETVVFNFQVGRGKTQLCYELVKKYADEGYIVIVCSPFIKLVEKDYKAINDLVNPLKGFGGIKGRRKTISNYQDVHPAGVYDHETLPQICDVHIMTINCLLGNPGDTALEQNFYKGQFLKNLID